MTNAKRNLILSAFSMVLCLAMLIGTTFAWFTDSESSGINTIVSGNLDIELEHWNGTAWVPVDASTLLFDDNALWEPGHTEVAYLHIKNAGNLSLKYKLAVNVGDEVLGTNVFGNTFKLSDYLVFGQIELADASAMYSSDDAGRAQARAAAGSTMGLSTYTEADNLYAPNDANKPAGAKTEKYLALVIYMPETVGNEANYMKGTTPPEIKLGVSLVATQLSSENDSFGNGYDILANGSPNNVNTWNAIALTASVAKPTSGEANLKAGSVAVTVPAGAVDGTDGKLSLTVKEKDPSGVTVPEGSVALVYDITLDGTKSTVADGDEMVVTITDLPKGLNNVYIYWNNSGTLVDMNATYDPVAGTATLITKHFSEYVFTYDGPVKVYSEEDFGPKKGWGYRGLVQDKTYILMNEITVSSVVVFNNNVTIDLNGHTLTDNSSYWTNYSNVAETNIHFVDSSTEKDGKIVVKNYLFDLNRNETNITFADGVTIEATAFGAVAFRISDAATLTVNNAEVNGQFYLAQPYGGTTKVVFNNCKATGASNSGIIAQHGYASASIETIFNGGEFTATSGYVVMTQNGYGNITSKFIKFNNVKLNGTIQNRQNMTLDACTIVGKIENFGNVIYKNDTTLNGVVQPNS